MSAEGIRDVDIRRSLHQEIRRRYPSEEDTLVIDELGLCQGTVRVDVAVVNGSLHGFEIKSDRDTLERLSTQAQIYNRALDLITVVTATKHAKAVRRLIPRWWGIWKAERTSEGVGLQEIRAPRPNERVDIGAVVELLWHQEVLEELELRQLAAGLRGKPRRQLWSKLVDAISPAELRSLVRERLKRRHLLDRVRPM